jgi:phage terminase large subunit-like protein
VSWEQLREIVQQDAAERAFWDSQPPRACPNDGTPLERGPDGALVCAHDGYKWPE